MIFDADKVRVGDVITIPDNGWGHPILRVDPRTKKCSKEHQRFLVESITPDGSLILKPV